MCRANIRKKLSTHVPPVLLYNSESKVHGHNFRQFSCFIFHIFNTRSMSVISLTCAPDQSEQYMYIYVCNSFNALCILKCIFVKCANSV